MQAITKKAIAERLMAHYGKKWMSEDAETVIVEVGLLNDTATLCLDAAGAGLNRRGYRTQHAEAPMRETLAAALVKLSGWTPDMPFIEPMCGSGTIAIEAAMIGRNMAPGLNRGFAAQEWPFIGKKAWEAAFAEARAAVIPRKLSIEAYDIDAEALRLARANAARANVADTIHIQQRDIAQFSTSKKGGVVIANPPYGQRMGDLRQARALYRTMGKVLLPLDWGRHIITSDTEFERYFGARADKKRKLYNGSKLCWLYSYR